MDILKGGLKSKVCPDNLGPQRHSENFGLIRESIRRSTMYEKAAFYKLELAEGKIVLSPIKIHYQSDYPQRYRINELNVYSIRYRYSDILLKAQ